MPVRSEFVKLQRRSFGAREGDLEAVPLRRSIVIPLPGSARASPRTAKKRPITWVWIWTQRASPGVRTPRWSLKSWVNDV